jgi:hypothetical protein
MFLAILNQPIQPGLAEIALSQAMVIGINFMGFIGIALIVYGIAVSRIPTSKWSVLESVADSVATYTTLIGTAITAISIYFPSNPRPPEIISIYLTAPIVIFAVFIVFYLMWFRRLSIPPHVINGFSILAIAGALNRLVPTKL